MGEVRWGGRKKTDHPPLTPPIKGGEKSRQRPNLLKQQKIIGLHEIVWEEAILYKFLPLDFVVSSVERWGRVGWGCLRSEK